MLVRKTWSARKKHKDYLADYATVCIYEYTGWFLFGFIPLYIDRVLRRSY